MVDKLEWQMDSSKKLKEELAFLKAQNLKAMADFQAFKMKTLGDKKPKRKISPVVANKGPVWRSKSNTKLPN